MSPSLPRRVAVMGALRSGTTLLRLMLDQHPRLACPGETDYMFDHAAGGRPGDPGYDLDALSDDRIYRVFCDTFGLDPAAPRTMEEMLQAMAAPKAAQDKADRDPVVVLMLHRNLDKVLTYLPDIRILHLVRDPRDVARSSIGMGWAGSVYYGVTHWLRTERAWAACAARFAPDQVLQVKYETLIRSPEETLERICAFFGTEFDPRMLSYDKTSTYSSPDPAMTYQWRRKLSPHEIGLVEARVGDLLPAVGYAPSGHPPVTPGPLERLRLAVGQRRATWGVRIARHGLRDALIDVLARRTGWSALARGARRRMDQRMRAYVK